MLVINELYKKLLHTQEGFLFQNINLSLKKGEWVSVIGPSGAGKTTLLNCLAGIYPIDGGTVALDGSIIHDLTENERSELRRLEIGFVFQDFKLLPYYSVLENVTLPLARDKNKKELKEKAAQLLKEVGIGEHYFHRLPKSLSGGEKQRVAIARAMINEPKLIICDEPTGNLDNDNKLQVLHSLTKLKKIGHTIIIVTHDHDVAHAGDRIFELKNGNLQESEHHL